MAMKNQSNILFSISLQKDKEEKRVWQNNAYKGQIFMS